MYQHLTFLFLALFTLCACTGNKLDEKGFPVGTDADSQTDGAVEGIAKDSLKFETRPSNVLLTGIPNVRLTTVYKVNIDKEGARFIGGNSYHESYSYLDGTDGNQWNSNYMPGIEAVYGYNLVNISHYDYQANRQRAFFEKPVLVRTLYYPSFSQDSLYHVPVQRNYFMVSAYNEDTNKDGHITLRDLRRFFWFDVNGVLQAPLVPENYSVLKSEYDPGNDFMHLFAQLDENGNGRVEDTEPVHIFWVDLKDPGRTGRVY
jgi:hypothetical protein